MAEKSSEIIKFLFNMKVVATINHNIDKDTAEYIVKEFGHKAILDDKPSIETGKVKKNLVEMLNQDHQWLQSWDTWIMEKHLF